jgi:hypothetical protein
MPAVSITRLQTHLELLRSAFNSSQVFVSELKDLLELYSDRTFRPGEETHQDLRIPRYYIPILLEKKLELEFQRLANSRPADAVENANLLWKEKHFESRLLAACLVGALPVDHHLEVLTVINQWLNASVETDLLAGVLECTSRSLRRNNPQVWFQQTLDWLQEESTRLRARGILALRITVQDEHFVDLPLLLKQVEPLFNTPPNLLIPDLVDLYQALVQRFPDEMLVYTRELMEKVEDPNKQKLLRKVVNFFDEPTMKNLRRQLPPTKFN